MGTDGEDEETKADSSARLRNDGKRQKQIPFGNDNKKD